MDLDSRCLSIQWIICGFTKKKKEILFDRSIISGISSICFFLFFWSWMHLRSVRRQFHSEWLVNFTSYESQWTMRRWKWSKSWDRKMFKVVLNLIKSITLNRNRFNTYCSVLHYHCIIRIKHGTTVIDLIPPWHYKIKWTALKAFKNCFLCLIWPLFNSTVPLGASWQSSLHCRPVSMVLTFVASLKWLSNGDN